MSLLLCVVIDAPKARRLKCDGEELRKRDG